MLTISFLRDNRELLVQRLAIKNYDAVNILDEILETDDLRRESQSATNDLQAEMNLISKKNRGCIQSREC